MSKNRAERRAEASKRTVTPKPIEGQFPVGSVVKLRSGGAPMTVEAAEGPLTVLIWHDADGVPRALKCQGTSLVAFDG